MNLVYSDAVQDGKLNVKDEPGLQLKKLNVKDEPGLLDAVQSYHPKGLPKRLFSQKSQRHQIFKIPSNNSIVLFKISFS